ncbi:MULTISPECIES: TRAP transporter large permease [unclassified Agrobacterium]|uniref:TRAP transporter large permease n=1 Tax=unclassified Agrobacterium TaxID=2632611 RepID=UPI00083D0036|nr:MULTISPECIES: TRAP transporter large permease [unclassified Agrobacterium]AOG12608.1 TRAP transporter, DctM subunit [Agrobacterium sp. RAC06]QGG93449.1 TRAP transporter large permease subunit [Agrobacterium sp. MA01]
MLLLGVGLFLLAVLIGLPVAFALLLASAPTFLTGEYLPPQIAVQKMVAVTQSYSLMAIPFFVLAGNIMVASGIAERLVQFSKVMVGWTVGGLAQVSIILSLVMGGISGSAVADAAMQSRLLGGPMIAKGYSRGFAAGVITYSSIITALIPPSIGLIVFGVIANVSVGRLLLAGIIPGLILTVALMVYTWIAAARAGYGADDMPRPTLKDVTNATLRAFWALMFPVFLLVGFRFGIFTATEAGAFVVLYSTFIGFFVYGELTFSKLVEALRQSLSDIGMIMFIIIVAAVLGHVIVLEQAPAGMAQALGAVTQNPTLTLLLVLGFLVIAGMLMEATVNVLLLTPIFLPILTAQGHDPIHVGVLMVTIITMGSNTPPLGISMFTVCGMLNVTIREYIRGSTPFFLVMMAVFLLLALVPALVTWLPYQAMGQ